MHRLHSLLFLLITLLISGCIERSADLDSPKSYSSEQITFQYPGNWKVSVDNGMGVLTLNTPGDAIVTVQTFSPTPNPELLKLAKAYSEQFIEEIPLGKVTVKSFTEIENKFGYQRILERFHVTLLGEKIDHHRLYAAKGTDHHSFFLIFQAPSNDYEKTLPGFELILKTLKSVKE